MAAVGDVSGLGLVGCRSKCGKRFSEMRVGPVDDYQR